MLLLQHGGLQNHGTALQNRFDLFRVNVLSAGQDDQEETRPVKIKCPSLKTPRSPVLK